MPTLKFGLPSTCLSPPVKNIALKKFFSVTMCSRAVDTRTHNNIFWPAVNIYILSTRGLIYCPHVLWGDLMGP